MNDYSIVFQDPIDLVQKGIDPGNMFEDVGTEHYRNTCRGYRYGDAVKLADWEDALRSITAAGDVNSNDGVTSIRKHSRLVSGPRTDLQNRTGHVSPSRVWK